MIVTRTKRKIMITKVDITKAERFKPIDIRIPSNVVRITGILVTTSASWINCGVVTLQAGDRADIFHVSYIGGYSHAIADETLMGFSDTASSKPWITGKVPELHPVDIDGDNVFIRAWFKGAVFQEPFTISIYVEHEGAEEFIGIEPERPQEEEKPKVFIL